MDLLLDEATKPEITQWFPVFWGITYEYNQLKKRVGLAYKALITGHQEDPHSKLIDHKRTVSFFFGLFSSPSDYLKHEKENFDASLIDSRYYTLGALYKNHFFITEIEPQLRLASVKRCDIEDEYLTVWRDLLSDNVYDKKGMAYGDPQLFANGLRQIVAGRISSSDKRDQLLEAMLFMDQLNKALRETDPERRRALIRKMPRMRPFDGESWRAPERLITDEEIASVVAKIDAPLGIAPIKTENVLQSKNEVNYERVNYYENELKTESLLKRENLTASSQNTFESTPVKSLKSFGRVKKNLFEVKAEQENQMQVDNEKELFRSQTQPSASDLAGGRIPLITLSSRSNSQSTNSQPVSRPISQDVVIVE